MLIKGEIELVQEGIFKVVLWHSINGMLRTIQFVGPLEACREWTRNNI